jgi:molybdopterin-guanine dinucleotide biosynthesis protein A
METVTKTLTQKGLVNMDDPAVKYIERALDDLNKKVDSLILHNERCAEKIQINATEIQKGKTTVCVLGILGGILMALVAFAKNLQSFVIGG